MNSFSAASSITAFPLVIDNIVFREPIDNLIKKGAFKKCNILNGFNRNEMGLFAIANGILGQSAAQWDQMAQSMNNTVFSSFLKNYFYFYPYHPHKLTQNMSSAIINKYVSMANLADSPAGYYKYLDRIGTDMVFACPAFQLAELYSLAKSNVYFYEYAYKISSSIYPDSVGVVHIDELALVFNEVESNKVVLNILNYVFTLYLLLIVCFIF